MAKDDLLKEYRSFKRKKMKEYRTTRPSDLTGGFGSEIIKGNSYNQLLKNIKDRIAKGEKRRLVVKDELIKHWKKSSTKTIKQLMKRFKGKNLIANEEDDEELNEGGGMFDDAGTIHIDEVEPTLKKIEQALGQSGLANNVLGSTGKKEYSGDIDIALPKKEDDDLYDRVVAAFGADNVRKSGKLISAKVPIENFDPDKNERKPRTGYIQVDFIRGEDPEWLKTYHYSPGNESKLKGAYRNIAISSVAAFLNRGEGGDHDDAGRPIKVLRWKWSNTDGLIRIKREVVPNKHTGGWVKKRKDTALGEPIKDPNKIAEILFKGKAGPEALNSVESVVDAVKKAYDKETAEQIFNRMAISFKTQTERKGKAQEISPDMLPDEVAKYYIEEAIEELVEHLEKELEKEKKLRA